MEKQEECHQPSDCRLGKTEEENYYKLNNNPTMSWIIPFEESKHLTFYLFFEERLPAPASHMRVWGGVLLTTRASPSTSRLQAFLESVSSEHQEFPEIHVDIHGAVPKEEFQNGEKTPSVLLGFSLSFEIIGNTFSPLGNHSG